MTFDNNQPGVEIPEWEICLPILGEGKKLSAITEQILVDFPGLY